MDSGATSHIICDEKKFTRFSEKFHTKKHTLELAEAGQETSSKPSAKLKSKSGMASPVRQCSTMHFMSTHSIRTYSPSVQRQKMEPQFHSARTRVTSIQMERILASPRETTSTTWIRYHQFRFLHPAMSVRQKSGMK